MGKPPADRTTTAVCAFLALAGISCERAAEPTPPRPQPQVITTKSGIEMVAIPASWRQIGSRSGKPDEAPVHNVWLDAFLIDRTEITQEHYGKFVLGNPSHFKGPTRPVEQVSWADAALYCNKRSRAEGLQPCYDEETAKCNFEANGYRLPTEAEWEYACRAGSDAAYAFGHNARLLKAHAWHADNAAKKTHPTRQKKPNAWGLFDMHGNVAEWCNDVYDERYYVASPKRNPRGPADGDKYVLRGGAWNSSPDACRAAHRVGEAPGFQDACFARDAIGFRCVRKAPGNPTAPKLAGTPSPKGAGNAPMNASMPDGAKNDPSRRTGFLYGDVYLRHDTGRGHPERPQRLTAIVERLKVKGLLSQLVPLKPQPAATEWLTTVHAPAYVERIERSCRERARFVDTMDCPMSPQTCEAAVQAVGGVLATVDAVMEGKIRNAFCAVRPPGHHARPNKAMGFCYFNNVAIAARYIQKKHKLAKVLIVDWDVHHGNGTQEMFDDDPTVFYFSTHQWPFYPGTGAASEKGEGKGVGTVLNVPLPAGTGDAEFKRVFEKILMPAALKFKPDFVLISAGFDAHERDLLGRMKVTTAGFAELTRIVKGIAEQCCKGRLVSLLEGGYNLDALAESVEAHIRVLME